MIEYSKHQKPAEKDSEKDTKEDSKEEKKSNPFFWGTDDLGVQRKANEILNQDPKGRGVNK